MTSESLDIVEQAGNLSAALVPVQCLLKMYHAKRGKTSLDDVMQLLAGSTVKPPIKAMLKFYDMAVQNCTNEFAIAYLGISPVWEAALEKALELIRSEPSDSKPTTVSVYQLIKAGVSIEEATTLQHNAIDRLFMTAIGQKAPDASSALQIDRLTQLLAAAEQFALHPDLQRLIGNVMLLFSADCSKDLTTAVREASFGTGAIYKALRLTSLGQCIMAKASSNALQATTAKARHHLIAKLASTLSAVEGRNAVAVLKEWQGIYELIGQCSAGVPPAEIPAEVQRGHTMHEAWVKDLVACHEDQACQLLERMSTFASLDRVRMGCNDIAALVEESKELSNIVPKDLYCKFHSCLSHNSAFGKLMVTSRALADPSGVGVDGVTAADGVDLYMQASQLRARHAALLDSCAAPFVEVFMHMGSQIGAAVHSWKIDGAAALLLAVGRRLSDEQTDMLSNLDDRALALCTTQVQPYRALLDAPDMSVEATKLCAPTFPPALIALSFLIPAIPEVAKVNKNWKAWMEFPTLQHIRTSQEGTDVVVMLKDVSQPSAVPLLRIAECLSTTGRFLADRSCRGFDLLDAGLDAPNQFNVWLTLAAVECCLGDVLR